MKHLHKYEPFWSIVQHALAQRGKRHDDYDWSSDYSAPRYVIRMCESLTNSIHEAGNQAPTLAEVIRIEKTCTGADYQHKLSLRCYRLAHRSVA